MAALFAAGIGPDAVRALYASDDLPDDLRMFLVGCLREREERRHRIACRQLAVRTLLALAGAVERTVYWHLAPEVPGEIDPHQLMGVMFGKLNLLAYEGRELTRRNPAADAFAVLAGHPRDATTVTQLDDHRVRIDDRIIVHWTDDVDEIPFFVTV